MRISDWSSDVCSSDLTWDIVIEPGELTHVDGVDVGFKGQIERPEFASRVQLLKDSWPLTKGMPFVNEAWSDAKASLLDDVSRKIGRAACRERVCQYV